MTLRAIVISPETDLGEQLEGLFGELGRVSVARVLQEYPSTVDLIRVLRAYAPHVIFLSTAELAKALELIREVGNSHPAIQFVALNRVCEPSLLLELMRAGVRESLSPPFERQTVEETLARITEAAQKTPVTVATTDMVYTFLPSKAGAGTSTIALNTASALARNPGSKVLLIDFDMNCGMQRFMLRLDCAYSVVDAIEHASHMDETLWPQLVSGVGNLDLLHSGRMNPGFRAEPAQIRYLIEFARRNYTSICIDLSGNMEKYSLELMQESRRIFLVCTPEIPSLHLAREKYTYLTSIDLGDRVGVLLNRAHKRNVISPDQVESLLGLPVHSVFANDYAGVHKAITEGRHVDPATELGKQFTALANALGKNLPGPVEQPKRFVEYFSLLPGRYSLFGRKPAV